MLYSSLIETENISALVQYVTEEPQEDMEEKIRFKYPHIACEVLTAEVFSITEKLCENEASTLFLLLYICISMQAMSVLSSYIHNNWILKTTIYIVFPQIKSPAIYFLSTCLHTNNI